MVNYLIWKYLVLKHSFYGTLKIFATQSKHAFFCLIELKIHIHVYSEPLAASLHATFMCMDGISCTEKPYNKTSRCVI